MTHLLTQNAKMKKSGGDTYSIWNFGIPAFQSKDGLKTCPMAGVCAKGCYAQAGAYTWTPTIKAYEWRLAQTQLPGFTELMSKDILRRQRTAERKGLTLVIRIHDSGDFYSGTYTQKWLHIMEQHPNVIFYAYTKMVAMFRHIRKTRPDLPDNFRLIFSEGGRQDRMIRATERHSRVFDTEEALIAAGYDDASNDDTVAFLSDSGKIGLVYHGVESRRWETGSKAS